MKKKRLFLGISLLACAAFMASCTNANNNTSSASSTTSGVTPSTTEVTTSTTSEVTPSTTTEVTPSTTTEVTPSTTTEVDPGTTTTTTTVDPVVSYTVTWYNEDGTVYASNNVNEGAKIVAPNTPTKASDTEYIYTFAGWYTSKDGGEKVTDFGTASKDVSYYARFEAATKITVSFMVDGSEYDSKEIPTGSKVDKPTNPTKAGYYLSYWALNGVEFDFNTVLTENTTLTAVFEEVKETENVGFGGSYTSWATLFANSTRKDSKSRTILGATDTDEVTMNGFTFLGKALLDGGILNTNASTIKVTLPSDNASLNMSATWGSSSDSGVIRVYKDGTQIYESTTTYSKSNGSVSLELTGLDAGDYEIKAEKTTATGQAGLKVSSIYYSKVVEYVSVNYQLNNGETKEATTLKKGTTLSELPSLVKSGYKFLGWYTTSTFDAGTEFALTDAINSNITLYAKWQELTDDMLVTISFNVNVAGQTIDSVQIEKGTALATLPKLDIEGYRFNKWFTDSNFQNEYNQTTTFDSNTTLYAEYIKIYTVTFLDNDGNTLQTVTVDDDTIISEKISKPYISGYKFDYWYDTTTNAEVDITTTHITSDMTLRAHYSVDENPVAKLALTDAEGLQENAYVTFSAYTLNSITATDYQVYLDNKALDSKSVYLTKSGSTYKAYIFGIKAGNHTVNVAPIIDDETIEAAMSEDTTIAIEAYDRSGYAHFGTTEGVGAYNDDGTLKDNAIVLYVTDENKNDIELAFHDSVNNKDYSVKGIGNILNSAGKDAGTGTNSKGGTANTNDGCILALAQNNIPLVVRFVGCVSNTGLYKQGAFSAASKPLIDGLTIYDSIDWGGSVGDNGHMARMQSGKDITFEGVGSDATIDGWGFHLICQTAYSQYAKNFEVRNLKFINTPEDAIGMEGQQEGSTITAGVEHCWVHNNEFYCPSIGSPAESDKSEGDGSVDFKRGQYFTCSYNYFEKCHKTNLVGSSDSSLQYNLSYHHNFWYYCAARGPLVRNANVHMYNNVFFGQSDYAMNPRANAYIYSEFNLMYSCKNPYEIKSGAIKSYGDVVSGAIGAQDQTIVTDKTQKVANNCKYGSIDYSSFELNSEQSYIPTNDYQLQTDVSEAVKVVLARTGVAKDTLQSISSVTLDQMNLLDRLGLNPTINELKAGDSVAPGKIQKTVYAFKVTDYVEATVSFASDTALSTGVLVNEAGVALLTASGTVVLTPGTYYIQPDNFQPGTPLEYKACTINSITLKAYDSSEYMAKILAEFNKAVAAIPSTIEYNDTCYNAINTALNKYNSLNADAKAQVATTYNSVVAKYNQYKNLGVEYVEGEIAKIVTPVTATNSSLVINARTAYNTLMSRVSDAVVSNYATLTAAETEMSSLAIDIFLAQADAIPATITYTADCLTAIENAETAYANLDEDQVKDSSVVTAYKKVTAARATYDSLAKVQAVSEEMSSAASLAEFDSAYTAYTALTDAEKASINSSVVSSFMVDYTIALIDSLPTTITLSDGNTITKARTIYDSLSTTEQASVTNYSKLTAAEATYKELAAATVKWSYDGTYSSDLITATGSAKTTEATFGSDTYSKALKLNSKASINFTLSTARKVTFYLTNSSAIKINGTEYSVTAGTGTTIELAAGSYEVLKGSGEAYVYAIFIE